MNNTQLYFAIFIPSFLIILAILLNFYQAKRLEDRIDKQGENLRSEIAALRDMLIGKVIEHEGRITRVEDHK